MAFSPLIEQLIEALRCFPGVGPKSAQRMTFHILERDRQKGLHLAKILETAINEIKHCSQCRTFSEYEICQLCANPRRNNDTLCIVETPADIIAIEQTGIFHGKYFVLMGHLSPLDGIGPEEIGMKQLHDRIKEKSLIEIILATNHTVEGEATAHYIRELAKPFNLKISRIAHGVPLGGELEYVDSFTLAEAISGRHNLT